MSSVDVVIPCYNYARFLEQCVNSCLEQPGVDVRVLVIDDCSTDDTPVVGERLAARDKRVEFRRHAANKGHIATYNEGLLGWASADYVMLQSADDYVAPGALGRAARLMDREPSVGMTYGMALSVVDERVPEPPSDAHSEENRIISGKRFLEECCTTANNPVPTPTAVMRTSLQHKVGGYKPTLPHSGDMEMWMRCAVHGSIAVLRGVQAYRRFHSSNMSHQYYAALIGDCRERVLAFEDVFQYAGNKFAEYPGWMATMRRVLSEEAFWLATGYFNEGNAEACKQALAFAQETSPAIVDTRMWRRLRTKRLLGASLWRHIGPAIDRLRGIRAPEPTGRRQHIGWWPQTL